MARSIEKKARAGDDPRQKLWRELALVVLLPLTVYLFASMWTYSTDDPGFSRTGSVSGAIHNIGGLVGAYMADLAFWSFGLVAYTVPFVLAGIAWIALFGLDSDGDGRVDFGPALRLIGIVGFLVSACGLLQLLGGPAPDLPEQSGGILGQLAGNSMRSIFGGMGSNLFLFVVFMLSVTLATGLSWFALMDWIGGLVLRSFARLSEKKLEAAEWQRTRNLREEREEVRKADTERRAKREPVRIEAPAKQVIEKSERAQREQQIPLFNVGGDTALPPLSLLDDPKPQPKGYSEETLETLSRQIEFKLKDFRIEAQVVGAYPGPVITRFELEPAPGVKGSQISSLDKDIARGLSVKAVRVVDVIPGKSVVGLEIPNTHREMIYLSELLRSKEYDKSPSPLTIALGKDIGGRPVVADLARMPHLLVAGTTGSGKSVGINAMVLSLLYKASAKDVKILMIDPKMLELSVYEGIPHLIAPVVTDMKEAANGLRWCVAEMERRYKAMSMLGVRNLAGFNRKVQEAAEKGQPIMDPLFRPNAELGEAPPAAGGIALHRRVHRRIRRHDDDRRQEGGGADRAPGAEGARLRHPFDPGDAAALGGRDHRPDQGQHPDPHGFPGVEQDRLAHDSRSDQAPKRCWVMATCCTCRPAPPCPNACMAPSSAMRKCIAWSHTSSSMAAAPTTATTCCRKCSPWAMAWWSARPACRRPAAAAATNPTRCTTRRCASSPKPAAPPSPASREG